MAWSNTTDATEKLYALGSVQKRSSTANDTYDTDMNLGNFCVGILALYSPSSEVKAYADYTNLQFIESSSVPIHCYNYQTDSYGGVVNSDGVYAIHSSYDPTVSGTKYTGDGKQVRIRREATGTGKGYFGYYTDKGLGSTIQPNEWVSSGGGSKASQDLFSTYYSISVYSNNVNVESNKVSLSWGHRYYIRMHTSSRSGYNGIVASLKRVNSFSFTDSSTYSGFIGRCSGNDHTEIFEYDLSYNPVLTPDPGPDIDVYFYYITDSTLLNTYSGNGQTNQYEFGDVEVFAKDDEPGYVNVTLQNDNTNYTGSSKTIASIASSSGTAYLGLGSSSTSAPTSWGSAGTSLSVTDAGTYYIWAKCDATSGYEAMSATYKGSVTINKATNTLSISPTSKTIYDRSGYNTFTITPSNAQGSVSYSSSNNSVATVNSSGVVTYVGSGSCTITVTAAGNGNYESGSKTCSVTGVPDSVSSLSISSNKTTIDYNGTATISVTATYKSGYSADVTTSATYSTSTTGIITIT